MVFLGHFKFDSNLKAVFDVEPLVDLSKASYSDFCYYFVAVSNPFRRFNHR